MFPAWAAEPAAEVRAATADEAIVAACEGSTAPPAIADARAEETADATGMAMEPALVGKVVPPAFSPSPIAEVTSETTGATMELRTFIGRAAEGTGEAEFTAEMAEPMIELKAPVGSVAG